jgi:hypothetical protein
MALTVRYMYCAILRRRYQQTKPTHFLPLSSFLTPDRLEKLNGIEFAWAVRGDTAEEAGNSDEAAGGVAGEAEVEPKEEEGESKEEEGEAKNDEETKPKPEAKKEDDGEASAVKEEDAGTVTV